MIFGGSVSRRGSAVIRGAPFEDPRMRPHLSRRHPRSSLPPWAWTPLAFALACASLPGPARAEDDAAQAPTPSAQNPRAAGAQTDPLEAQYRQLQAMARQLVEAYEKRIAERVEQLAASDPTIHYLVEKQLFTAASLTRGLPEEPLARIPWLRKTLETMDERAHKMAARFGNVTKQANERAAIRTLHRIAERQEQYRENDSDGDGVFDYAESLEALAVPGLTPTERPGVYRAQGYRFRILFGDVLSWSAEAVPIEPGKDGERFFFVDERGRVRAMRGRPADAASPIAEEERARTRGDKK